jgi:hypothetical protein
MEGEMTVDTKQERLVALNGHLMEDVKFGGGLLPLVTNNDSVPQVYRQKCIKLNSYLKPLTGTLSQSESSKCGHGLVVETPAVRTLRPLHARFRPDSHGSGLSSAPGVKKTDAPPDGPHQPKTPQVGFEHFIEPADSSSVHHRGIDGHMLDLSFFEQTAASTK